MARLKRKRKCLIFGMYSFLFTGCRRKWAEFVGEVQGEEEKEEISVPS